MIGCGRFFEGNAAEMHEALNKRLASLPDDTVVYVSHAPSLTCYARRRKDSLSFVWEVL